MHRVCKSRVSALIRAGAAYLVIAAACTLTVRALDQRAHRGQGLHLTVIARPDDTPTALFERTTPAIDLTFLDHHPQLPTRFFSATWTGFWYLPTTQVVDLYAGADDRVVLRVDGQPVLERNADVGMHTIGRALRLTSGVHSIAVEYEQDGGGTHLNVQWAPAGGRPAPLDPVALFSSEPRPDQQATVRRVTALRTLVWLAWLVPPLTGAFVVALPAFIRAGARTLRTGGSTSSRITSTRGLGWIDRHPAACLIVLMTVAGAWRVLLVAGSPAPFGYVYDPYYEPVEMLYRTGSLPESTACWQCYHPPLFYLAGLPFFAAGMWLFGHDATRALSILSLLAMVSAAIGVFYGYRLLRLFRLRGLELVLGASILVGLPLSFVSSYGPEADILSTAILMAFLYYLTRYHTHFGHATLGQAIVLGALAGLAMATKYSGLIAILVAGGVLASHLGRQPWRVIQHGAIVLAVSLAIGSWKYIENAAVRGTVLYANGSAQEGFRPAPRQRYWDQYDFLSFELADLLALSHRDAPAGNLTYLPVYRSVWTTLHGMAWSDMSFFSNPTRGGIDRVYVWRGVPFWLTSGVLVLGLVPNLLALGGALATLRRRALLPLPLTSVTTFGLYIYWFTAQETWALKTKYILFLLPVYALYAIFGLRWLRRWATPAVHAAAVWLLVCLVVLCHAYLYMFAVGAPAAAAPQP